jgi:hypothetical protein
MTIVVIVNLPNGQGYKLGDSLYLATNAKAAMSTWLGRWRGYPAFLVTKSVISSSSSKQSVRSLLEVAHPSDRRLLHGSHWPAN